MMNDYSFHYLIMSQHAFIQKMLLNDLKFTNLTIGQPKILDFLLENEGLEQKDIARGCHIEPGSLTTLLNRMEQYDLLERRSISGNRRSYYIFLTEKGRKYAKMVKHSFQNIEEKIFKGFSEEEQKDLIEKLTRIYINSMEESENNGKM